MYVYKTPYLCWSECVRNYKENRERENRAAAAKKGPNIFFYIFIDFMFILQYIFLLYPLPFQLSTQMQWKWNTQVAYWFILFYFEIIQSEVLQKEMKWKFLIDWLVAVESRS